jgi:hypothetical protein
MATSFRYAHLVQGLIPQFFGDKTQAHSGWLPSFPPASRSLPRLRHDVRHGCHGGRRRVRDGSSGGGGSRQTESVHTHKSTRPRPPLDWPQSPYNQLVRRPSPNISTRKGRKVEMEMSLVVWLSQLFSQTLQHWNIF